MANNKIIFGDEVLIDLTEDTVTPDTLAEGYVAHDRSGNIITGVMSTNKVTDVSTNEAMTAILTRATDTDIGEVYRYVGVSDGVYENGSIYIVTKEE